MTQPDPGSLDLRLLEPFVVLVEEELHFRSAAERLGIGQPALSRQLARLQRELGATLIVRDQRQSLLTPAGARFLVHARAVLHRASTLASELAASVNSLRLHMGNGAHRGAEEFVTAFMAAHPSITVDVAEGTGPDARTALVRRSADVGFDLRTGCLPGMAFQTLERAPLGVLTAAAHPIARRGRATWDDLAEQPVLFGPSSDSSWNALVRNCLAEAGVSVIEVVGHPVPRLHYLVPLIARGEASLITGLALFDPLPAVLAWTELMPRRDVEFGFSWDPQRGSEAVGRFLEFATAWAG